MKNVLTCVNDTSVLSQSLMIARKHAEQRSIMQTPTCLSCGLTVYFGFTVGSSEFWLDNIKMISQFILSHIKILAMYPYI